MATANTKPRITRGFVPTSFGQVHYRECGAGQPVVFLHMTPGSSAIYAGLLEALGPGIRGIAMDTPGYGDSDSLGEGQPLERYAGVVTEVLDGLGLERATIFGLSTGSVIAAAAAIEHPDRVERLVLCEVGRFNTPDRQEKQRKGLRWTIDPSGDYYLRQWQTISRGFGGRLTMEQAYVLYVDSLRSGAHSHEAYVALVFYDLVGQLGRITCPTLLVNGEFSTREEPIETFLSGIPGSRLVTIPGAANAGPLEQPEATAALLRAWLESTEGAAS